MHASKAKGLFQGVLIPALFFLAAMQEVHAGQLEVHLSPSNAEVRKNVANYLGDLGARGADDLQRYQYVAREQVRQALQALGYYNPTIDTQVLETDEPTLRINVRTGARVKLRRVDARITGPAASDPAFSESFAPLAAGRALHHGEYEAAKRRILDRAFRLGYFDGAFSRQQLRVDPEEGVADVTLLFASGPRYRLGDVVFQGSVELDRPLLERMVPFKPGTPYDSALIADLDQTLRASGYFVDVRVDADPARGKAGVVPVQVELTMRPPRTIGAGVGYATDIGPRVRLEWLRHWRNREGHAYGADAEISPPRQNFALWYHIPLDPPLTDYLRLVGGYRHEELADNDSLSRLLSVGPERHTELDSGWERALSLKWQHEEYRLGDDEGVSTLLMPGIAYSLSRSDNRVDPSRGYRLGFGFSAAKKGLMSDADLIHAEAAAEGLVTLWQRHRFLTRLQLGANLSSRHKDIPPSLRFFAGGDRSVRGYEYQALSPANADGDHIGGRYQFTVSGEYQYSLTDKWRLAAFLDQGNAFDSLDLPTLKTGVGLGVRWVSPVGPIRIDLARALDGGAGLRLHFSVGPEL